MGDVVLRAGMASLFLGMLTLGYLTVVKAMGE